MRRRSTDCQEQLLRTAPPDPPQPRQAGAAALILQVTQRRLRTLPKGTQLIQCGCKHGTSRCQWWARGFAFIVPGGSWASLSLTPSAVTLQPGPSPARPQRPASSSDPASPPTIHRWCPRVTLLVQVPMLVCRRLTYSPSNSSLIIWSTLHLM